MRKDRAPKPRRSMYVRLLEAGAAAAKHMNLALDRGDVESADRWNTVVLGCAALAAAVLAAYGASAL